MQTSQLYKGKILNVSIAICAIFIFSHCSISRKIPQGKYLLVKNKITCDSKDVETDDMYNYVRQKPNRNTFFIKYHLRMFYLFEKSQRRFGTWARETIGEHPSFFDTSAHVKTIQQLQLFMNERGYYNAKVNATTKIKGKRNNKIKVTYTITAGKVYIISKISYVIPDTNIAKLIYNNADKSLIEKHKFFDVSVLQEEQKRLSTIINNYGYYTFNENKIYYTADTSKGNANVELTISVKPNDAEHDGMYKKYIVKNTFVYPDYIASGGANSVDYDTVNVSSNIKYLYNDSLFVSTEVIQRANYIENDSLYKASSVEKTQRQISQNKLFKLVTISFKELEVQDSNQSVRYLDCYIYIAPFTRQAVTFEVEGTNTGGDWGAEINGSYIHKNIFHGAENLSIKAKAAGEYNKALKTVDESLQLFNSHELGVEINLEIPNFLSPIKPAKFDYKYRPKTNFRAAYNFNKTPDYTRPTTQLSYGYTWFGNTYSSHSFKPIDISYIYYYDKSDRFNDFLKSRDYYKYSYEDYVIYSMNYSYIFYNKSSKSLRNYQFVRFNAESSGNALYGLYSLSGNKTDETNKYETFNVVFAQYVKTDLDIRYYQVFNKQTSIVYRAFGGLAIPYNNSEGLPSVKKYFCGGANSMRAWASRTLGPGSYMDKTNGFKYYLGDVKLEANIEARFHMFSFIDGAVFLDMGNIWSFRDNELKGAEFFAKSFLQEIAIGTGYGLRFDFSFFVFRTDLGMRLKEPTLIGDSNSRIIWGNRKITGNDFNLNIGIGYPF